MTVAAATPEQQLTPIGTIDGPDETRIDYGVARTMQTDLEAVKMLFPPASASD